MNSLRSLLPLCIALCHAGAVTLHADPVTIHGRATGPDGVPLEGVRIELHAAERFGFIAAPSPPPALAVTATDGSGAFSVRLAASVLGEARSVRILAIQSSVGLGSGTWQQRDPAREMDITVWPLRMIRGTVRLPNAEPARNARVRLSHVRFRPTHESDGVWIQVPSGARTGDVETVTDAHGRFTLRALPDAVEGRLSLAADAAPHAWWAGRWELADAREDVEIQLEESARIEGRVAFEGAGAPAAGVTLNCRADLTERRGTVTITTTTDETGHYALTRVPAGDYVEVVPRPPDVGTWVAAQRDGLRTKAGQTLSDIDFTLSRGTLITGTVTDTDGNPVGGALVLTYNDDNQRSSITADDGRFAVRCVPGSVSLYLSKLPRGYARAKDSSKGLTAVAGEDLPDVRLVVERGVMLRGRATDPEGRPVAAAKVTSASGRIPIAETTTDAEGKFVLADVSPSRSLVVKIIHRERALGATVRLAEDTDLPKLLEVKLELFGTACGRVLTPAGEPLTDQLVHYGPNRKDGTAQDFSTVTDGQGRYRFAAAAGIYDVGVGISYLHDPQAVEIKPGEESDLEDIEWVVPHKVRVVGTVVDPDGEPVPRLPLVLTPPRYLPMRRKTNRAGRFSLGRIELSEELPAVLSVVDADRGLAALCAIGPDTEGEVTLKLAPSTVLTGRVVDDDGVPVTGARLTLFAIVPGRQWKQYGQIQSFETAADGTFRFEGVLPGRQYSISSNAPGHESRSTEHMSSPVPEPVELDDIVLRRTDQFIEGVVTDHEGRPLSDVRVSCREPNDSHGSETTDDAGKFRIDELPRGTFRLECYKSGYGYEWRREVAAGTTDLAIVMWPENREPSAKLAQRDKPAPELADVDWAAPGFTRLKALIGKPVVLCFWSIHSRHAARDAAALRQLQRDHAAVGLTVVTVHDASATRAEQREFAAQHELSFSMARVEPGEANGWMSKAFTAYGVRAVPKAFLIDAQGVLRSEGTIADIAKTAAALLR